MPLILWLIFCYDSQYKKARLNESQITFIQSCFSIFNQTFHRYHLQSTIAQVKNCLNRTLF